MNSQGHHDDCRCCWRCDGDRWQAERDALRARCEELAARLAENDALCAQLATEQDVVRELRALLSNASAQLAERDAEVKALRAAPHTCAIRASSTYVYLADGTKVVAHRSNEPSTDESDMAKRRGVARIIAHEPCAECGDRFCDGNAPHDGLNAGVPIPEPNSIRPCPRCKGSGVVQET